jgi:uncharacterized protein
MLTALSFKFRKKTPESAIDAGPIVMWGPVAAFLIVVLTYVSQFFAPFLALGYITLVGREQAFAAGSTSTLTPQTWFVFVLLVEMIALGVLYTFLRARRISFWKGVGLRFQDFKLKYLGYATLGFLAYLSLAFAFLLVAQFLPFLDADQKQALGFETSNISQTGLLFAFASLVILPPIAEEMIFRGFLFGGLRAKYRFLWTALLTSVFFGGLHLMTAESGLLWIGAIDTFLLSLVLCYAREETGNIWTSIFIHALKNGMAFLLLFKTQLF